MARLTDFDDLGRDYYESMEMPHFASTPWTVPKPVAEARVAIVSTAGLQRRGDRPFSVDSADYRPLPAVAGRYARGRSRHEPHLDQFRPERVPAGS